jgi:1-deoxy-D-xylulose-5-phosphate reductoisomerase
MTLRRKLSILGSTGSIGESALDVVRHLNASGQARIRVQALAANQNAKKLLAQARVHKPALLAVTDMDAGKWLKRQLPPLSWKPRLAIGSQALVAAAEAPGADMVLTSVVGAAGLVPTLAALRKGRDIALANKETLVAAGELVCGEALRHQARLLPVDSEHSAIFQCLAGLPVKSSVKRLVLTASGGPFRDASMARLRKVTAKEALKHPTWKMGPKITIDSATMMNKGLEVIEAHWLFGMAYDQIDVVVHPQSVIHSMVETVDGSVLAQMGAADMRLPIQVAMTWPGRLMHGAQGLNLLALSPLTFLAPDLRRFPCLRLAYEAGRLGGTAPAVVNAANEAAVAVFLKGGLSFLGIPQVIEAALKADPFRGHAPLTLDAILRADAWARSFVEEYLNG